MGCANIAWRSMLPALRKAEGWRLAAVASRTPDKAQRFADAFGAEAVVGYEHLLERDDIDAIYMPLPTGLHREWVAKALGARKHLLVEKSFAEDDSVTRELLAQAQAAGVCVIENYLFVHHAQTQAIREVIQEGAIGDLLLLRTTFSFPPLSSDNFRYQRELGGGALLDAGGYTAMLCQEFLGKPDIQRCDAHRDHEPCQFPPGRSAEGDAEPSFRRGRLGQGEEVRRMKSELKVLSSWLEWDPKTGVDLAGATTLRNSLGVVAQCYFGFHSYYQCLAEFLGTRGKLSTGRIFTAPPDLTPSLVLDRQSGREERTLPADNQYRNMWRHFRDCILAGDYEPGYQAIELQADLLTRIRTYAHGG